MVAHPERYLGQRLTLAGILFVASEIQAVASGDKRSARPDEILSKLIEIMTANINDPDSGAAITPILMRAPAQYVDAVKFTQTLRGYKTSEVDWVLDRLSQELDSLRGELAVLRAQTTPPESLLTSAETEQ